jgi:hypothetical protein
VIDKPVDLGNPFFFGINTVTSLSPKSVARIRQAYTRKYPELRKKLAGLFG